MQRRIAILALVLAGCDTASPGTDGGGVDAARQPDAGYVEVCTAHSDCDDGVFCNGAERCIPGDPGADPRGCLLPEPACMPSQTCDEEAGRCITDCGAERDADGDGHESDQCGGDDCDDADANRYPGNIEVCNDHDEDCVGSTLAGTDGDADGDGYVSAACCGPVGDGVECGPDCDDARADVHPGVADACGNGDEDCDGAIDEDPTLTVYPDADADGFGVMEGATMACFALPGYALRADDCDDARASVHPGAIELCNGRDDDCNTMVDDAELGCDCTDGMRQPCGDTDVGDCELGVQTCIGGRWGACDGEVAPRDEVCGGGDEDCDGMTDEPGALGGEVFYADSDGDGFGNFFAPTRACSAPMGYVIDATDCNDLSALAHPGVIAYSTTPACRNGATATAILCPGDSILAGTNCWVCGSRYANELDFDFDCDGGAGTLQPPGPLEGRCGLGCMGTTVTRYELPSQCGRFVDWSVCEIQGFEMTCGTRTERRRLPCR